jgi:BirA family biotin operon repressor/biotin-[acetyl-CoA-carboxylase] ligase
VPGWQWRHLREVASTQDLAIAAGQGGEAAPLVITADRQTAGRGRGGRAWQAPEGNLNFSALLRPGPVPLQAAAWSLLAGVAVYNAVAVHMPDASGLMLKWPNDLLLGGAKLAGVLIDSALTPSGRIDWVVIGVGVNIAHAPALPDRPTACLEDAGIKLAPETLAATLISQLDHWMAAGPKAVRAAWLQHAHPLGTALHVHQGDRMAEGTFAGLAEDGSLLLAGAAGATAVVSGDVFLS